LVGAAHVSDEIPRRFGRVRRWQVLRSDDPAHTRMIAVPVAECGRAFEQTRARLGEQRDGDEGSNHSGGRRQNFTNGVRHGLLLARFEG
jgi:hypothetical protein